MVAVAGGGARGQVPRRPRPVLLDQLGDGVALRDEGLFRPCLFLVLFAPKTVIDSSLFQLHLTGFDRAPQRSGFLSGVGIVLVYLGTDRRSAVRHDEEPFNDGTGGGSGHDVPEPRIEPNADGDYTQDQWSVIPDDEVIEARVVNERPQVANSGRGNLGEWKKAFLPELKAEALRLRLEYGLRASEISKMLNVPIQTCYRWLAGKPRGPRRGSLDPRWASAKAKKAAKAAAKKEKEAEAAESTLARAMMRDREAAPAQAHLPTHAKTATGELSPVLVKAASWVVEEHLEDLAEGVVFEERPIEVIQSEYIIAHSYEIWDRRWFLRNRRRCEILRDLGQTRRKDLADEVGVSSSTVSRWEQLQRTPASEIIDKTWLAYTGAVRRGLDRLELILIIRSHPDQSAVFDLANLQRFIDDGPEDLSHVEHLYRVRQLVAEPRIWDPPARDSIVGNRGYGTLRADFDPEWQAEYSERLAGVGA